MKRNDNEVRLTDIIKAEWVGADGCSTYSLFGLDADGRFYRYVPRAGGWTPESRLLRNSKSADE